MKVKVGNFNANGSCFQGHMPKGTTYQSLVKVFGEPNEHGYGDGKVTVEWRGKIDGELFTIYDWKEYRPISQSEIIGWHIGGESSKVTRKALNEIAMMILIKHQK